MYPKSDAGARLYNSRIPHPATLNQQAVLKCQIAKNQIGFMQGQL